MEDTLERCYNFRFARGWDTIENIKINAQQFVHEKTMQFVCQFIILCTLKLFLWPD